MKVGQSSNGVAQRGQVLPLFGITVLAMIAIAALVIDLGFLFGQRRFDQNGADAAALAAGQLLARNVTLDGADLTDVYFGIPDTFVYELVREYAGLDPDNVNSHVPTGVNQNGGMLGSNFLNVTLEYNAGGTWCSSRADPLPSPRPGVLKCAANPKSIGTFNFNAPPDPVSGPYRVRVTVSSTTEHFLAQVVSIADTTPPVTSSEAAAACAPVALPPGSVGGSTTCAQAVAAVKGSSELLLDGPVIPVTTAQCMVDSGLVQLWGPNPSGSGATMCGYPLQNWKNVLDFTDSKTWKDDPQTLTVYPYDKLFPEPPNNKGVEGCTGDDCGWDRGKFKEDKSYSPTGRAFDDVPAWIALGFDGEIHFNPDDGNKLPTYVGNTGGDAGQNVAVGFYCTGNASTGPDACPDNPGAGTYFFGQSQGGFFDDCRGDPFQDLGMGCRNAAVPIWGTDNSPSHRDIEWYVRESGGSKPNPWYWTIDPQTPQSSNGPARVRIVDMLTMRFYCNHAADGLCTRQPSNLPISGVGNGEVWGRFVGAYEGRCETCTGKPTIFGNTAVLER